MRQGVDELRSPRCRGSGPSTQTPFPHWEEMSLRVRAEDSGLPCRQKGHMGLNRALFHPWHPISR